MQPNVEFIREFLLNLLQIPSPTGNTEQAILFVEEICQELQLPTYRTHKGSLVIKLPHQSTSEEICPVTVASHVDTLGGMVKKIKSNGRLALTALGGYLPSTVAGEYCYVETSAERLLSGTVLLCKQSGHIYSSSEMNKQGEAMDDLEVRLDARTSSKANTEKLGIGVGDFVYWDTRTEYTEAGFIKSRHIDNKAGVAASLGIAEMVVRENIQTSQPTYLYISTYEEVGHGAASGIPADTHEILTVDMAPVGNGQSSDEFGVTICVKDASGPYDLSMRRRLVTLAKLHKIPHNLDVYVRYTSDGSAALFGGTDARTALIGPGVDASHAYERTHIDSVLNTTRLIAAYLTSR